MKKELQTIGDFIAELKLKRAQQLAEHEALVRLIVANCKEQHGSS